MMSLETLERFETLKTPSLAYFGAKIAKISVRKNIFRQKNVLAVAVLWVCLWGRRFRPDAKNRGPSAGHGFSKLMLFGKALISAPRRGLKCDGLKQLFYVMKRQLLE